MSADIIGNFSPLDELIQLIYQSIYQFVVMSSVTYDKWTVHVGMVGDAGRWWRGVWEEKDVVGVVVSVSLYLWVYFCLCIRECELEWRLVSWPHAVVRNCCCANGFGYVESAYVEAWKPGVLGKACVWVMGWDHGMDRIGGHDVEMSSSLSFKCFAMPPK